MAKTTKASKVAAKPSVTKKAKKVDYKALKDADLYKKIELLRIEVLELKRGTVIGEVQNVRAFKQKRRELARALTARNQVREVK